MDLQIIFQNTIVPLSNLLSDDYSRRKLSSYEKLVAGTIGKWYNGSAELVLSTSGSTGLPKQLTIRRKAAILSAKRTISYFLLQPGDTSLLCLDCQTTGGFMMIVRSLVAGMNIIVKKPDSKPLAGLQPNQFPALIAMVPLQLANSIDILLNCKKEDKLIKGVLVGGAPIDDGLADEVKKIEIPVYQTFGMTETTSHIALKKISGNDSWSTYRLLPGIAIKSDTEKKLSVNLGSGDNRWIKTNDMVDIQEDNSFRWLGRADNVINSGGIKINPEMLEPDIGLILKKHGFKGRYYVAGLSDRKYTEKLGLFLEGALSIDLIETLRLDLRTSLPKYLFPKEIICLDKFLETDNGKIKRGETRDLYLNR